MLYRYLGTSTSTSGTTVNVTGVGSTGSIGTTTVTLSPNISVTGVSSTGSIGTVSTTSSPNVSVTGVSATSSVGSVTVDITGTGVTTVNVTGVVGTVSVGSVTCNYDYKWYVPVNYFQYSEQLDTAPWSVIRSSVTANVTTAPDATSTADKLVENTDNNSHYVYCLNNVINDLLPISFSVYAKAAERSIIVLLVRDDSSSHGFSYEFNLSAVTVVERNLYGTGSYLGSTIEDVGSGWYRCTASGLIGTDSAQTRNVIYMESSPLTFNYAGDGSSGLYLWGAQLETNCSSTQYIPTTSSIRSPLYATSSIGTVTTTASANVSVTGVNGTGYVGTVEVVNYDIVNVNVTGISADGSVGTVSINNDYVFTVSGVNAIGSIGTVSFEGSGIQLWTSVTQSTTTWTEKTRATSNWNDVTQATSTWVEI